MPRAVAACAPAGVLTAASAVAERTTAARRVNLMTPADPHITLRIATGIEETMSSLVLARAR